MTYIDKISNSKKSVPRRTVLYGVPGIGKSTWCANVFPDPVFIPTEDGLRDLDVMSYPVVTSEQMAKDIIGEIYSTPQEEIPFKSIVIDSADWLERRMVEQVCTDRGVEGIGEIDYGKGKAEVTGKFRRLLDTLDDINRRLGLWITFTAHEGPVKQEPPNAPSWVKTGPGLLNDSAKMLVEWADEVLYAKYEITTDVQSEGFGRDRIIVKGEGSRIIHHTDCDGHYAKHRLSSIPDDPFPMEFDGANYRRFLGLLPQKKGEL